MTFSERGSFWSREEGDLLSSKSSPTSRATSLFLSVSRSKGPWGASSVSFSLRFVSGRDNCFSSIPGAADDNLVSPSKLFDEFAIFSPESF